MTFGPELPPEEQARRIAIVTRIGFVMLAAMLAFILFAALVAPLLIDVAPSGRRG